LVVKALRELPAVHQRLTSTWGQQQRAGIGGEGAAGEIATTWREAQIGEEQRLILGGRRDFDV